jgi:hypothetical protein
MTYRMDKLEKSLNEVKSVLDRMKTHSFFAPYFADDSQVFAIGAKVAHKNSGLRGVIVDQTRAGSCAVWKVRCELKKTVSDAWDRWSQPSNDPNSDAIVFGYWDEDLLLLVK